MKKVQHEKKRPKKRTAQKKLNVENVQHEKSNIRNKHKNSELQYTNV